MYDWFPIVFIVFKVVVLGTGMFFAIKWHHDQAKKDAQDKRDAEAKPDPQAPQDRNAQQDDQREA
ncbi:hypothetical protein LUTEI9C_80167 [Luteimonas sp. 9C]|nr:hypothetical protein LUTEI9C_80167 [Luteimonas sp. 9C]